MILKVRGQNHVDVAIIIILGQKCMQSFFFFLVYGDDVSNLQNQKKNWPLKRATILTIFTNEFSYPKKESYRIIYSKSRKSDSETSIVYVCVCVRKNFSHHHLTNRQTKK